MRWLRGLKLLLLLAQGAIGADWAMGALGSQGAMGRVRRDPGTPPVPNFFSSTRPVPTRKLKMTGYRVIKFHFESNETQPRMKRTANKVKDPINSSTGKLFLSFIEESEQEQMQ